MNLSHAHVRLGFATASAGVILLTATSAALGAVSAGSLPAPAARTCAAFSTWTQHRTQAHLDAMMTDSEHVQWTRKGSSAYIAQDAVALYSDARAGAPAKYLNDDISYMRSDCKK